VQRHFVFLLFLPLLRFVVQRHVMLVCATPYPQLQRLYDYAIRFAPERVHKSHFRLLCSATLQLIEKKAIKAVYDESALFNMRTGEVLAPQENKVSSTQQLSTAFVCF
jgi:hypothetical protein